MRNIYKKLSLMLLMVTSFVHMCGNTYVFAADGGEGNFFTTFKNPATCVIVGLVIAAIVVFIMFMMSRTGNGADSKTYLDKGSVNFPISTDKFIRTETKERKIQTNNNNS